ncbi:MAG: helix-turn-helix domain-containing protein [Ferruginibacter sp.]
MNYRKINPAKNVSELLKLLHLSEFQKNPAFHILKFEDHFDRMPKKISLVSEGYFEISFITQSSNGTALLQVEETVFRPEKNRFTFVAPGQVTHVNVQGNATDGYGFMLVFTADFIEGFFSDFKMIETFPFFNIQISPVYAVSEDKSFLFLNLIEAIYSKFQESENLQTDLIKAYLKVLLLEIKNTAKISENFTHHRSAEITFAFENLIKKTPAKHQPVKFYAKKLHISPVYLSECIKWATNLTVKQLIDKYIVLEAQSLLQFSTKNIGEIATELGFEDRSNFINFFKRKTGKTPRDFRNFTC